jgi:hypothetical protein
VRRREEVFVRENTSGIAIIMTDPDIADRVASVFETAAFVQSSRMDEGWLDLATQIRESARASFCHCGSGFDNSDHCPECGCEQYEGTCEMAIQ